MKNLYRNKVDKKFFVILAMIFLSPDIRIPGLSFFRLEHLFSVLLLVYFFVKDNLVGQKPLKIRGQFIVYLILGCSYFLSLLNAELVGIDIQNRDFIELYKIVVYSSLFVVASKYNINPNNNLNIITNMIFILSILAIAQYFNFLNLNQLYVHKIAPTQYITLISNHITPRVIGLSSNPNTFGFITAIGCAINMYLYLYYKSKIMYIFKTLVIFIALMMTFSRTGLIIMIVMIIILFLGKLNLKNINSNFRVFVLSLSGLMGFIFLLPEKLKLRLINFSIFGDSSFQARYDNWEVAFEFIKKAPFFGVGTTNSISDLPTIDNEWLLLLKTYGFVGTMIFILGTLIVMCQIKEHSFKILYFSVLIGTFLFMVPASVYNTFQLMSVVIILGSILSNRSIEF